jgi:hypothetical protein
LPILGKSMSCERNDRRAGPFLFVVSEQGSNALRGFHAIETGHKNVHQDSIGHARCPLQSAAHVFQRIESISHRERLMAGTLDDLHCKQLIDCIILSDKNDAPLMRDRRYERIWPPLSSFFPDGLRLTFELFIRPTNLLNQ